MLAKSWEEAKRQVLWAKMPFSTDGPNGIEEIVLQRSERESGERQRQR